MRSVGLHLTPRGKSPKKNRKGGLIAETVAGVDAGFLDPSPVLSTELGLLRDHETTSNCQGLRVWGGARVARGDEG